MNKIKNNKKTEFPYSISEWKNIWLKRGYFNYLLPVEDILTSFSGQTFSSHEEVINWLREKLTIK